MTAVFALVLKMTSQGTPSYPIEERRTEIVNLRATPGEKAAIEKAAARAQRTISDWVRVVILQAVGTAR